MLVVVMYFFNEILMSEIVTDFDSTGLSTLLRLNIQEGVDTFALKI